MPTLHRRQDEIKLRPRQRPYDYRWAKYSKAYLHTHRLCVLCKKEGITKISEATDHIVPISEGGDMWNPDNHQALCYTHHNRKTQHEQKTRKERE